MSNKQQEVLSNKFVVPCCCQPNQNILSPLPPLLDFFSFKILKIPANCGNGGRMEDEMSGNKRKIGDDEDEVATKKARRNAFEFGWAFRRVFGVSSVSSQFRVLAVPRQPRATLN